MIDVNDTTSLAGRSIRRIGYGAMRITGQPGNWGPPADVAGAVAVLRKAVELGVNFIDTADAYGPGDSEELIAEALHPYPPDLLIATKGGTVKLGPGQFHADGSPGYLDRALDASLKRLRIDTIDLYQLHRVDPATPLEVTLQALENFRQEGRIRHIGLSNISVEQLELALGIVQVASVQNRYSLLDRSDEPMVRFTHQNGITYISWGPLAASPMLRGSPLAKSADRVAAVATKHQGTPIQVGLAWLLQRSPNIVPIPGTTSLDHLTENIAAISLRLDDHDLVQLEALP